MATIGDLQSPQAQASDRVSTQAGVAASRRILSERLWLGLSLLLVLVGIGLRLERYLLGRSFRNDEAALALAIQGHSLGQLISQPLPGGLTAPVGFLLLEKLGITLLGNWDYVFRLLPLVAGCASVVLMYWLTRQLLGKAGTFFALGAFAVNWNLLFYSSDLKQYSTDVFFAVAIFAAVVLYFKSRSTTNAVLLAVTGAVAVTLSHPAVFVLASVAPVLLWLSRSSRLDLRRALATSLLWAVAFLALYLLYYRVVGQTQSVVDYWNNLDGIMPRRPWEDPTWFGIRGGSYLTTVAMLSQQSIVNVGLFLVGIASFQLRRRSEWAFIFLALVVVTLAASRLVNYPFKGRLILFLLPGTFLAMGEGIDRLITLLKPAPRYVQALAWIPVLALLWAPVRGTYLPLERPRSTPYREDIKPVLAFVQAHWQPEDIMVVYDQASITYGYYAPFYGLDPAQSYGLPEDRNHPRKYLRAIDGLPSQRRTWFIFSSVLDVPDGTDVRTYILNYIKKGGGQILEHFNYNQVSFADLVILR